MRRIAVLVVGVVLSLYSITHPLSVDAQGPGRVYRIGVLGAGTAAQYATRMGAFRQGLRDLGWVDERAITFDEQWADAGHYERLPALAAELVAHKVDLIFGRRRDTFG